MTREELMEYKKSCGARAAADLLLLNGPDAYEGDYDSDMEYLEKNIGIDISIDQALLIKEMVWNAIENGNRATGKPFTPDPVQYRMLCDLAGDLEIGITQHYEDMSERM